VPENTAVPDDKTKAGMTGFSEKPQQLCRLDTKIKKIHLVPQNQRHHTTFFSQVGDSPLLTFNNRVVYDNHLSNFAVSNKMTQDKMGDDRKENKK
jgi:hypothetical protein